MKMGVGFKIAGGFGVLILLVLGLGYLAISNMSKVGKEASTLADDYVPEVKVANNVERSSFMTMYNMRGYIYAEEDRFLVEAKKHYAKVKDSLDEAAKLASKSPVNLKELDSGTQNAKKVVEEYSIHMEQMERFNKALDGYREEMGRNAGIFLDNVGKYLADQDARLVQQIDAKDTELRVKDRVKKIKIINDVVDTANATRIAAFKSMVERDPEQFKSGVGNLQKIETVITELLRDTVQEENKRQLTNIIGAVRAYEKTMVDFLKTWLDREGIAKQMLNTGTKVLDIANSVADNGMKETQSVANDAKTALSASVKILITGLIISVLIGIVFAWALTMNILKPINRSAEIANTLAAQSEELSTVSGNLLSASEEMSAQSNNVSAATEQMSANINAMASASEEMNVNAQTVSSASEQMSQNMSNIAGAIEEMSTSMGTVGDKAKTGTSVGVNAMKMSSSASATMNELGKAAQEIGQVTEVIKRIAEQTNLLALNATIEAASAGEAGRGFAVVANEIKELANQSARAAEDIAAKIRGVQGKTDDAVKVIGDVSGIIAQLNESVEMISTLVQEQLKVTNDISSNVAEANKGVSNIASSIKEVAEGTKEMSRNAGEAAKGATDVSSNIAEVKVASTNSSASAGQVNSSAGELAKLAGELKGIVAKIKGV